MLNPKIKQNEFQNPSLSISQFVCDLSIQDKSIHTLPEARGFIPNWELINRKKRLKRYRKKLIRNLTPAEKIFRNLLYRLHINFKMQKVYVSMHKGTNCIIDFFLPKPLKIAFEIDGKQHLAGYSAIKDRVKEKFLRNCGIKIYRIDNEILYKRKEEVFEDLILVIYLRIREKKYENNLKDLSAIINRIFEFNELGSNCKCYDFIMKQGGRVLMHRKSQLLT